MTIRAYEISRPENAIEDASVITARYGDDTPGYYAVSKSELSAYISAFETTFDCEVYPVSDGVAMALCRNGVWIGINVAATNGIVVWGRASIEGAWS